MFQDRRTQNAHSSTKTAPVSKRFEKTDDARDFPETGITGEEFVATEAGQGDFQVRVFRGEADKKCVYSVSRRLVHRFEHVITFSFEIAARYPDSAMSCAATFRELFRQRCLIRFGPFIFLKSESNGTENPPLLRSQSGDGGRIEPGRKKDADRNISDKMVA